MPPKKRSSGDLVIVESPAKAKTIERYLGPGYTRHRLLRPCPRPPAEAARGRPRARLRAALRAAQGAAQGAREARRPGAQGRDGLARHRPRSRGRVDRLAHRRLRRPRRRPRPPRDLQRDHQARHRGGLRPPPGRQPRPGQRPAGAAGHRSPGRLQAQPAGRAARSAAASRRDGCRAWRCAWSSTASARSTPSPPRSTGPSPPS